MTRIIPTIFAKKQQEFQERFERLMPIASEFQIDFMDGKFHSVKGVMPSQLKILPQKSFEAHMMVKEPHRYVDQAKKLGFQRYLFHIESQDSEAQTKLLIKKIHESGMKAGVVLNPKTSINKIKPFLKEADLVMFMGHEPGHENVGVDSQVYKKIRNLREQFPRLPIEVDGGVDEKTAARFKRAGATRLSVGSAISSAKDPRDALRKLRGLTR